MEAGQGLRYPYPLHESQSAPSENDGCSGVNRGTGEKGNQEALGGFGRVGTLNPKAKASATPIRCTSLRAHHLRMMAAAG